MKSVDGMTMKRLKTFINKGLVFGASMPPSEFISLFERFLTQTLETTDILKQYRLGNEYPSVTIKKIYYCLLNCSNTTDTVGDVIVEVYNNKSKFSQTFRLEFDAQEFVNKAIKNGFSAKIIDNRFKKQKIKYF